MPLFKLSLKPNRSQFAVGIAFVIAITVAASLAWGFCQQLVLAQQMRAEEIRLEQKGAGQQARQDDLVAESEYVKSDECVERWAREEMVMTKAEETAVVLVTDTDGEPAIDAQPTPLPEPEARPLWVELWELVFGPTASAGP